MVGIVSYGAYLPKYRLGRSCIMDAMGWLAPGLMTAAQGERTFCNWDEDAMTMAVAAAWDCMTGQDRSKLDGAYIASTSLSFTDRDSASILKSALNLKDDITTADFTSTQKAGTSALVTALEAVQGGDKKQILLSASDSRKTRTAWFHERWFGAGAAALVLGKDNLIAELVGSFSLSQDFVDHYRGTEGKFDYNWEERWIRDEGYGKIIPQAVKGALAKTGLKPTDITRVMFPCLFGRAHWEIAKSMGFTKEQLAGNMHEETGECGVAHPLIMLARELETAKPGDKLLVASFGQGSDALIFKVTDKIKNLAPRLAVSGHLANSRTEYTYGKFLRFRDLLNTEMGIRAEVPMQTALSAMWRERKLVLGFVGGKCKTCGTPQIPKSNVCVKPECGAVHTQEDYEFVGRAAKILTFTSDLLAVSIDPPASYGMIQFEGGGRMMMDFTDCTMNDIEVGVPMQVTFRKKYYDKDRCFTGYFWSAAPVFKKPA